MKREYSGESKGVVNSVAPRMEITSQNEMVFEATLKIHLDLFRLISAKMLRDLHNTSNYDHV